MNPLKHQTNDGKVDLAEFLRLEYQRNLFGLTSAKQRRDSTPFYQPIKFFKRNASMHRFEWNIAYIRALAIENEVDLQIDPHGKLVNK